MLSPGRRRPNCRPGKDESERHIDSPNVTPALWAPRSSLLTRIPASKKGDDEIDPRKHVYVDEVPQVVRDEQAIMLHEGISGGIDKATSLSWIICGSKVFIWSLLSSAECVVLQLPSNDARNNTWLLCAMDWCSYFKKTLIGRSAVGVVICNHNTRAVLYWDDIYEKFPGHKIPSVTNLAKFEETSSQRIGLASNLLGPSSLIATAIDDGDCACVAIACFSNGELWMFYCSYNHVCRVKVDLNMPSLTSDGVDNGQQGYPRSLIWRLPICGIEESKREFLLLTDQEIQCHSVQLYGDFDVSKLWSCGIIGTGGINKQIWPLEIQVDDRENVISILIATLCKDLVSSSSYTQYSVMTVHYKSEKERAVEEVIISKARVEDEELQFSMRLRVGGKSSGSTIILSGDGTATISHNYRNSTRVYQLDLLYGDGKVLDALVLPSENYGEGAWVVLTEKAVMSGIARRTEESDSILGPVFHEFLLYGQVDVSLENLRHSGAFQRDGETNIFARTSKSIVDSLAKHWTTTRGDKIVVMAVVSDQLIVKQHKHQKLLQFLAMSKCHKELCSGQRHALQIILEHGEKLVAMIRLRELQGQNRTQHSGQESEVSIALWDLVQLVGERARRNTRLLMDRDNAEVFYSIVSDNLEEVFHCLDKHLEYLVSAEMPSHIQIQRACELSNACVTIIRESIQFRSEHQMWYPPPAGLTPWHCEPVVLKGLWSVASFMLQLLNETSRSDVYSDLEVLAQVILEAYAGAVKANVERGDEHKGLLDEYWNRRDVLLDSLYRQAKGFAEAGCQDLSDGAEEKTEEPLRKLSSHLLSIAKRHQGYKIMWKLCCDLSDPVLLGSLMNERGGFSYFVCEQMYEREQFSKLLSLGEEFREELSIFLKQHQDLRWLHQVFLSQFSAASQTLHVSALPQDDNSAEERTGLEYTNMEPSLALADRKWLLNLSNIASIAASMDDDSLTKMKRVEADLKLLILQDASKANAPSQNPNTSVTQVPTEIFKKVHSPIQNLDIKGCVTPGFGAAGYKKPLGRCPRKKGEGSKSRSLRKKASHMENELEDNRRVIQDLRHKNDHLTDNISTIMDFLKKMNSDVPQLPDYTPLAPDEGEEDV